MICWDSSLSLGIEELDAQHRALIALTNALEGKRGCEDPAVVDEALRFLRNFSDGHFPLEEMYMRTAQFPGRKAHTQDHELFINQVIFLEIEKEFGLATSQLIDEILAFLMGWFADHIAGQDRAFHAYLHGSDEA